MNKEIMIDCPEKGDDITWFFSKEKMRIISISHWIEGEIYSLSWSLWGDANRAVIEDLFAKGQAIHYDTKKDIRMIIIPADIYLWITVDNIDVSPFNLPIRSRWTRFKNWIFRYKEPTPYRNFNLRIDYEDAE